MINNFVTQNYPLFVSVHVMKDIDVVIAKALYGRIKQCDIHKTLSSMLMYVGFFRVIGWESIETNEGEQLRAVFTPYKPRPYGSIISGINDISELTVNDVSGIDFTTDHATEMGAIECAGIDGNLAVMHYHFIEYHDITHEVFGTGSIKTRDYYLNAFVTFIKAMIAVLSNDSARIEVKLPEKFDEILMLIYAAMRAERGDANDTDVNDVVDESR